MNADSRDKMVSGCFFATALVYILGSFESKAPFITGIIGMVLMAVAFAAFPTNSAVPTTN